MAIASSPAQGDTYRAGEHIEVTLTFSTEAYTSGSVVAIRVGEGADDANYRPAEYASGSGTNRLTYRYRVQLTDFDADGISVDVGGPPSGFGKRMPATSAELGSVPVSRNYSGVPDDAGHKVDGAVTVAFGAPAFVVSEDGITADVTVALDNDPHREVVIPITATPGGGATPSDYSVSPASLVFASGQTTQSITVTAVDDRDVDGGESVRLGFGTLPPGVRAGSQAVAFVVIDDNDGFDPIVSITDVDGGSGPGSVGFTVTQRPRHHGGLGHQRQRRGPGRRLRGGRHPHHHGRRDDRNGQRTDRRTAGRRRCGRPTRSHLQRHPEQPRERSVLGRRGHDRGEAPGPGAVDIRAVRTGRDGGSGHRGQPGRELGTSRRSVTEWLPGGVPRARDGTLGAAPAGRPRHADPDSVPRPGHRVRGTGAAVLRRCG